MSKYWVFQNNQVNGPHDADDLAQLPGFSGETLVCSEGRKGTSMGDWQRASMVPELSVALLKASQLVGAMKGAATGSTYGSLPPEPTLKDLAALGSLQEKVSLLDNVVGQLQESLRLKENELLSLHRELEDKNKQAAELATKLGGLEERLSSVNQLREGLDKAVAAEHDVESTVSKQAQTIDELTNVLQTEKDEIERLKSHIEELRSRPVAAPPMAAPMGGMGGGLGGGSPFGAPKPPAPAPLGGASAPGAPAPLPSLAPDAALPPSPAAAPALDAAPFGVSPAPSPAASPFGAPSPDFSTPAGMTPMPAQNPPFGGVPNLGMPPSPGLGLPEMGLGAGLAPAPVFGAADSLSAPPPAAMPVSAVPPSPIDSGDLVAKPAKKGPPVALIAVALLAVAGAAAFKLGMIPGSKPKKNAFAPEAAQLPPAPPPPVVPKGPTPEELAEQAKQKAIDLVRTWPAPGGKTLQAVLETASVQAGGLSPWMADKIKDQDYQVNFYSPKSSGGSGLTYEFEADLAASKVAPHNAAAKKLLTAAPAAPKKKKIKIKAKKADTPDDGPLLNDLLGDGAAAAPGHAQPAEPAAGGDNDTLITGEDRQPAEAPAKPAKRAKAEKPKPEASLDDLLQGGHEPAKLRTKPQEPESLDQMLLPGIPKQKPELDEPQAKPKLDSAKKAAPADDAQADEAGADDAPARPAAKKGGKSASKAADAALLDDLLKP